MSIDIIFTVYYICLLYLLYIIYIYRYIDACFNVGDFQVPLKIVNFPRGKHCFLVSHLLVSIGPLDATTR